MFWLVIDRVMRNRRNEILITTVLAFLSIGFLFWALAFGADNFAGQTSEKIAFAILVAITVRWVGIWFSEMESLDESSLVELLESIKSARSRVWINQTWLPGTESDGNRIEQCRADDVRIMLASHKPGSPIFPRIEGRGMSAVEARSFAKRSIAPLVGPGKRALVRFNPSHHPGWIAVVDSFVFWGPTPANADNWANDCLFHRHAVRSERGRFWVSQFEYIWNERSHDYPTEKGKYNPDLP